MGQTTHPTVPNSAKLDELKAITAEGLTALTEAIRERETDLYEIRIRVDRLCDWMNRHETFLDGDYGARERIKECEVRLAKSDDSISAVRDDIAEIRMQFAEIRSSGRTTWNAILYGIILLVVGLLIWTVTTILSNRRQEGVLPKNENSVLQSQVRRHR